MSDLEHPGMVVVLDVNDIGRTAAFWSAVLGFPVRREITQFTVLRPDDPADTRPHLILQKVPEAKVVKNRSHLDLHVPDVDAARDRYLALGARLLQESKNCIGDYCWYLMSDPEGNEFCVAPG
ncbi:MAG: VOC family protein [Chloroflexota bacterium]|nr:VOC family protein [Chloroflexota bacterium]